MSPRSSLLLRSRHGRVALVGAACFSLGSLALVYAGQGDPVSGGHLYAIADADNTSHTAGVNESGELRTIDVGASARLDDINTYLDRLSYDPDHNLKVAAQGTTQVGGHVSIDNLPQTQQVAGTVEVGNFPATQNVEGTVSIANLPAVQAVAGAVAVTNFPANQPVAVSNFPATQNVGGVVAVSNLPANQPVTVSNFPGTQAVSGTVHVGNLPATQDVKITGGSVTAAPAVTNENAGFFAAGASPFDVNHPIADAFGLTMNVTTMSLAGTGPMRIQCSGPGGMNVVFPFQNNFIQIFPAPLELDKCTIFCDVGNCSVAVSILGYRR